MIMSDNNLKLSFEFFPAKDSVAEEKTWESLKKLENFNPQFFSVTFGAGGGERLKSDSFVKKINKESSIPVAGHLTCVDMSKDEINDLALGWFEKELLRLLLCVAMLEILEKNILLTLKATAMQLIWLPV